MTARSSTDDATLPSIEKTVKFWKRNGLTQAVAIQYQQWVRRFMLDCAHRNLPPLSHLTAAEVKEFAKRYARRKRINRHKTQRRASAALHAWSIALAAMGMQTAPWSEPGSLNRALSPLMTEYVLFRRLHANAADSSIKQEVRLISDWLEYLRSRGRPLKAIHLKDVDAYVLKIRRRYAVGTVGTILSSLRLFLRFLRITGRLRHDLASSVQGPPRRRVGPPRALPWSDVQRLLRAVDRGTRPGLRDYAMLLLMSLYGLGSAEVVGLKLEDVHWRVSTLSVHRPKTGVDIELPLLPAAARALAGYLRRERPPDAPSRSMFVCHYMPHVAFTSSAIRYVVRKYAAKAGIQTRPLGAHVLRHSHASRQVDQQAPPRVLSSILGHRDPESTSVYTRVAIERLRGIALPVPR
jgi:site-specific recombinase XerD